MALEGFLEHVHVYRHLTKIAVFTTPVMFFRFYAKNIKLFGFLFKTTIREQKQ